MLHSLPIFAPFFLALRNMLIRRARTALTLFGIVLGVAVVLAIQITNQSTLSSIRQVFDRAAGSSNLLVVAAGHSTDGVATGMVDKTARIEGVVAAVPSLMVQTILGRDATSFQLQFDIGGVAPGSLLQLFGIDPALDPQVRVYELAAGRLPELGRYEAALPAKYAAEKGLGLGDDLVLVTPSGEARLDIVGLLADDGVALLNDGVVAFAPLDVVQELFLRDDSLDEIALRVETGIAEDPRLLANLKEAVSEQVGDAGRVIYPAARGELVPQMLATYQQGLSFFAVIAIFVGAFLIYNTFSMTVVERTREIGMLRAIGMSRFLVLRLVLAEALVLAVLGSALGVGAGVVLARGLMRLLGAVVSGENSGLVIPAGGLAESLLVGLGVTLGAALLPAFQAARTSPLEALRARGRSSEKVQPWVWLSGIGFMAGGWFALYRLEWPPEVMFSTGILAVLMILLGATLTVPLVVVLLEPFTRPLVALIYNHEGAIGSSNVQRAVSRTTLTVASLMVALTMVIGIGSLAYSFENDIADWIETAIGGDLFVRSPVLMRESFGRQLAAIPGVRAVTPARYIDVRVGAVHRSDDPTRENTVVFNAIDPLTYRNVGDIEFATGQGDPGELWREFSAGNGVLVSSSMADRYNLRRGDELVLVTRRGEHAFRVVAEMIDFTGQSDVVVGSYDDLRRWYADRGADRFTVSVAEGYSISQVGDEIENRYGKHRNVSVQSTAVFKDRIRSLMDQAFRLFDVLNLIGVIIGALGVVNTLAMNVLERQREIGGLRSLGMTRGQILRMVLAESLAMGILGGVYGLVFGYVIAHVMILGMNMLNGYELTYRFTVTPFILGILIALVVSQLAALSPARAAARVNIVEAIKHE